jgi:hypothetical protein
MVAAQRHEVDLVSILVSYVLPANQRILRVEPRGFEPLTTAVQEPIGLFYPSASADFDVLQLFCSIIGAPFSAA